MHAIERGDVTYYVRAASRKIFVDGVVSLYVDGIFQYSRQLGGRPTSVKRENVILHQIVHKPTQTDAIHRIAFEYVLNVLSFKGVRLQHLGFDAVNGSVGQGESIWPSASHIKAKLRTVGIRLGYTLNDALSFKLGKNRQQLDDHFAVGRRGVKRLL